MLLNMLNKRRQHTKYFAPQTIDMLDKKYFVSLKDKNPPLPPKSKFPQRKSQKQFSDHTPAP